MQPRIGWRIAAGLVFGALVWAAPQGRVLADKKRKDGCDTQQVYIQAARLAVVHPLAAQARNGQVLDQTVWNHHFVEQSDELHPSGTALLDRLARRYAYTGLLEIYLETAHDLKYRPDKAADFAAARDELDARRAAAVANYLGGALRRTDFRIAIHDPARVGMPAEQANKAVQQAIKTAPRGMLPASVTESGVGIGLTSSPGAEAAPAEPAPAAAPADVGPAPDFSGDVVPQDQSGANGASGAQGAP